MHFLQGSVEGGKKSTLTLPKVVQTSSRNMTVSFAVATDLSQGNARREKKKNQKTMRITSLMSIISFY